MSAILDRILLGADLLLVGGVAAAGVMGESLPLPSGLDVLVVEVPETPKPLPPPPPPPAPVPAPVVKPESPEPGAAEYARYLKAKARAGTRMGEAHEAPIGDPGRKRRAYTQAEEALKEAIRELEAWKAARPDIASTADEEATKLRSLIMECHKSKPMEIQ